MEYIARTVRAGVAVLGVAGLVLTCGSCASRLEGEPKENQKPSVWFVNVPSENSLFSTNPIINWIGQDVDGQVVRFRYAVVREDTVASRAGVTLPLDTLEVTQFIALLNQGVLDSAWRYLEVSVREGDPQTSEIVRMTAEITDPVNTKVAQYVFLQAFDEGNTGSDIVFRRFLRNNNPPNTRVVNFDRKNTPTYVNAAFPFGITGVKMFWSATDIVDYPADPPPFEFEWKLLGPYEFNATTDRGRDTTYERVIKDFRKEVFVTNDAKIFYRRATPPDTFIVCDTVPAQSGDSLIVTCDTVAVDDIVPPSPYGSIDTLLDITDPQFEATGLYRVADSSLGTVGTWVTDTRDSSYDVFSQFQSDSTRDARYIFWIRCRDDALTPDLTPDFVNFIVVDPKYERDIAIIDFQIPANTSGALQARAREYWIKAIDDWEAATGIVSNYNPTRDFINSNTSDGLSLTLKNFLAYKVVIGYQDDVIGGNILGRNGITGETVPDMFNRALQSGVNAWIMGRSHFVGASAGPPIGFPYPVNPQNPLINPITADALWDDFSFYFGGLTQVYSGWFWWALITVNWRDPVTYPLQRIEDFDGALSINTARWPNLEVDTLLLERRYRWGTGNLAFRRANIPGDTTRRIVVGSLPEVNWTVRDYRTELMYLYKSRYGSEHYLGVPYSFEANPVAFRYNRGLFRSAYWNFTPYSIDSAVVPGTGLSNMQVTMNDMLNWLYLPQVTAPPSDPAAFQRRLSGADAAVSVQEMQQKYLQSLSKESKQKAAASRLTSTDR